jgi:FAD-dependent oxidoreductase domain-containing protein 1
LLNRKLGSKVELLSKTKLKEKFPYLNVEDIELGSNGLDNEGWFDPWSLLNAFKRKATALGVQYINADVCGFEYNTKAVYGPNAVIFKTLDGKQMNLEFSQCVLAGGYESGRIAKMAGIGTGKGILSHPIPVEPKYF